MDAALKKGVEKANKEVWEKESEQLIDKRLKKFDEMVTNFESYFSEVQK